MLVQLLAVNVTKKNCGVSYSLYVLAAGADYNEMVSPKMVTLSNDNKGGCTNVFIIEDVLIEGQEYFFVFFQVYDYFGSYTLEGNNLTMITIVDSNGKHNIFCIAPAMSHFFF